MKEHASDQYVRKFKKVNQKSGKESKVTRRRSMEKCVTKKRKKGKGKDSG